MSRWPATLGFLLLSLGPGRMTLGGPFGVVLGWLGVEV